MQGQNTAVIVAAKRSAVGKAPRGVFRTTRPDDIGVEVLKATLASAPFPLELIEDVLVGCAMPEAEQGMNVARNIVLHAGLPDSVPAATVNRYCASGLQTIAMIAERIQVGAIDVGVAGGVESMSLIPMGGHVTRLNPAIVEQRPEIYMNMGLTAENVASRFEVSRADQDAFSLESHRRALEAQRSGHFAEEIVPVRSHEGVTVTADEGPRADTSLEALGKLPAVFRQGGSVTAGNSSQMSDGAAFVVLMSEAKARELGLQPIARFVGYAVAGVAPEIMGIGPVEAIPKLLKKTGVTLDQIDTIELNEAFAAQSLAVIRKLGLDPQKTNPNGGAIALGHPLGCTGAKLTATALSTLKRTGGRYGLVSMCVGGGMGAAGLFERL
ncbi:MAG: acetyl-CoA acetyltransferase [Sorangiineae bacterium NIC37A_2]|jgi:acetyl-CoA acyltransferase|nr:MAG: acetyl-CoA acetyltransferase [Sorangiineae bacterium NIC37A_2]